MDGGDRFADLALDLAAPDELALAPLGLDDPLGHVTAAAAQRVAAVGAGVRADATATAARAGDAVLGVGAAEVRRALDVDLMTTNTQTETE